MTKRLTFLLLALLLAGCAAPGANPDSHRRGSFYGGVSGGAAIP